MTSPSPIDLSVREPRSRLFDEPLVLRARSEPGDELLWRARYRDDDGRVWKAAAGTPAGLTCAWEPAKPQTGPIAALASLRPVNVDVRVEAGDGRAAGRQVTRQLLGEGVKARRWRDGLAATLYLPADPVGSAVLLDATAQAASPAPAAALLASRGVLTLAVTEGDPSAARERLAAVPGAPEDVVVEAALIPPNVGVAGDEDAHARMAAWDALLERAGARPRVSAG